MKREQNEINELKNNNSNMKWDSDIARRLTKKKSVYHLMSAEEPTVLVWTSQAQFKGTN